MGGESVENEAADNEPDISAGAFPLSNTFEGKGAWAILPEGFAQVLGPLAEGLDVRLGDAVASVWVMQTAVLRLRAALSCMQRSELLVAGACCSPA